MTLLLKSLFCRISSSDIGKIPFILGRAFPITYCAIFLLLQVFAAEVVCAYDITVIKSDNIKLYDDALEGFKSSCNCSVNVIDLSRKNVNNIVEDIVDLSPDAVVAIGSKAYKAVKSLKTIRLFTMLAYPYDTAEEGNIWWVSTDIHPDKYLNAAAEILPHSGRIGILINPALSGAYSRELLKAGKEKGLQIILREVTSARDVPAALSSLSGKIDLLMMIPDTTVAAEDSVLSMVSFSYQNKIPLMTFSRKFLEMGALLSLEIDPYDIGKQTGETARGILKNGDVKPASVYYARKALLVINYKIAVKLGIRIPVGVIREAEVLR
ncbi:MAG TPA: ABC transporter substrate binding protein [Dissulfurispiraceae bacterium]|nr:ABC transporter substrate binding protein [Dissulfurispiraceae bacterium]